MQVWFDVEKEQKKIVRIVTMFVTSVGFLLNFAVIFLMIIDPCKILRKGPWVTILNLAAADLISCVSYFCTYGETFFLKRPEKLYHAIVFFSNMFGVSASFFMLTFLTVQTFLVIKFPFHSRNAWLTMRKIISSCTMLWIFSFLFGLGNISWLRYKGDVNLKIYVGEIGTLHLAVIVQIILNVQVAIEIRRSRHITENASDKKQRNMAKTVVILTVILVLTAFPYFILRQLRLLVRLEIFGRDTTSRKLYAVAYFFTPFATLNFVVNPILYALRLPDYRKSFLACLGKRNRDFAGKRTKSAWLTSMNTFRSQRTSDTQNNGN